MINRRAPKFNSPVPPERIKEPSKVYMDNKATLQTKQQQVLPNSQELRDPIWASTLNRKYLWSKSISNDHY